MGATWNAGGVDTSDLDAARAGFERDGVARMDCPLEPQAWAALCAEVMALKPLASRKEFRNVENGNTLRLMSTIGKAAIVESGAQLLGALYRDRGLRDVLEAVIGGELFLIAGPDMEEYCVNWLHREGDTQGAHLDNYAYSVVLVVEAPEPGCGGLLEFFDALGDEEPAVQIEVAAGDCLILRANRRYHRVSPLTCPDSSRLVVGMGYADAPVAPRETAPTGPLYAPGDHVVALDDLS